MSVQGSVSRNTETQKANTETVTVALAERSYPIHIGKGLLARAGDLIRPNLSVPRVFVVTDKTVAALYLSPLLSVLDTAGIRADHAIVPPGEESKSFRRLEWVLSAMLDARCERSTTVVALGGGVIGDLAGFAAAIFQRGMNFIQIPTTLLAQVDSSVGGKTGINMPQGKNMVGAFHQPVLVLSDLDTLSTLPPRQIGAGYAEIVKYGCINDPAFFDWLEGQATKILSGDPAALAHAVAVSCRAKAAIVSADERESGQRALLNLGHTFGHALEAETGFSDALLHGEAVALGMVMAFKLSAKMGLLPPAEADRLIHHLSRTGLPTGLPPAYAWKADRLMEHMAADKKTRDGRLTFVLARGLGRSFLCDQVDPAQVRAMLLEFGAKAD